MCLKTLSSKKEINEFKKTIGPKGITVYKVVRKEDGKYHPLFKYAFIPFKLGLNKANITEKIELGDWLEEGNQTYQSGFHFWVNKKNAENNKKWLKNTYNNEWCSDSYEVIECIIKKSWITYMGMNHMKDNLYGQTVVTNKAIFPEYKE